MPISTGQHHKKMYRKTEANMTLQLENRLQNLLEGN